MSAQNKNVYLWIDSEREDEDVVQEMVDLAERVAHIQGEGAAVIIRKVRCQVHPAVIYVNDVRYHDPRIVRANLFYNFYIMKDPLTRLRKA